MAEIGENTNSEILINSQPQPIGNISSKNTKTEEPAEGIKPTAMHYFIEARQLVKWTFISMITIFILIFISEWVGKDCISGTLLSIVKDFLYPFLTLMIGYLFGKGFPNEEHK